MTRKKSISELAAELATDILIESGYDVVTTYVADPATIH